MLYGRSCGTEREHNSLTKFTAVTNRFSSLFFIREAVTCFSKFTDQSFTPRISFPAMLVTHLLLLLQLLAQLASVYAYSHLSADQESQRRLLHRLSKPLIGDDGRVYACSDKNFFAFENNGSILWTIYFVYNCNAGIAPVHGGRGKIYLVAENRILKISFDNIGTAEPAAEVFFVPEPGEHAAVEIIGISV